MSPGVQRCDSAVCGPVCSLDLMGTDLHQNQVYDAQTGSTVEHDILHFL